MDWCGGLDRGSVGFVVRRSLAQAAVGPVFVVVLDELLEQPVELVLVPDEGLVE